MQNVFEIWEANGRKVPFAVRRWNWTNQYATVIEHVECEKMPYGKAFGYPTTYGQPSSHYESYPKWRATREVPNAGSYQWELVQMTIPQSSEIAQPLLPASGVIFTMYSVFGFGKFRGRMVREVLETNPGYISWASQNVKHFEIDAEVSGQLQMLESKK